MTNLNTFKVSKKKEAAFSDYIQAFRANTHQFQIKEDIKKDLVLDQMAIALSKLGLNEPVLALNEAACAID